MKAFYELINQYPWTTFYLAIFILIALDRIVDALVIIFKRP